MMKMLRVNFEQPGLDRTYTIYKTSARKATDVEAAAVLAIEHPAQLTFAARRPSLAADPLQAGRRARLVAATAQRLQDIHHRKEAGAEYWFAVQNPLSGETRTASALADQQSMVAYAIAQREDHTWRQKAGLAEPDCKIERINFNDLWVQHETTQGNDSVAFVGLALVATMTLHTIEPSAYWGNETFSASVVTQRKLGRIPLLGMLMDTDGAATYGALRTALAHSQGYKQLVPVALT